MFKALLKKQLLELVNSFARKKSSKKSSSNTGVLVILIICMIVIMGSFLMLSFVTCGVMLVQGMGWLFLALMSLLATIFGTIGSVFSAYNTLYCAKDNDLLLSMPIPARMILIARTSGIYITAFIFESLIMIPAIVAYIVLSGCSAAAVLICLLTLIMLPLLSVSASAILGGLVALITAHIRHKNIITVIFSVLFVGVYLFFYTRITGYMNELLDNLDSVSDTFRTSLYPFMKLGQGMEGDIISFLIFAAMVLVIFAVIYALLSVGFFRLAAASSTNSVKKTKYKEKNLKVGSQGGALLRRELSHFFNSPTYMLNCGLSMVLLPAFAVFALIKSEYITMITEQIGFLKGFAPFAVCLVLCLLLGMMLISAPSVSLEGKRIWIVQSLPVTAKQALDAKLQMHMLLCGIPALISVAILEFAVKPDIISAIFMPIFVLSFTLFIGTLGLIINLKSPNLDWTNEAVPIKQSMGIMVTMLIAWVSVAVSAGIYIALFTLLGAGLALVAETALFVGASLIMYHFIRTWGTRVFSELG